MVLKIFLLYCPNCLCLYVLGCPPGQYGVDCSQSCPDCQNGGSCDGSSGLCVCLSGFTGSLCNQSK